MTEQVHALQAAQGLLNEGDVAGAIPLLLIATDGGETKQRYIALLSLSRAYTATGAATDAEGAARRAIEAMPQDCTGYALLALNLMEQLRLSEAAEAAEAALRHASNAPAQAAPLMNLAARIAILRGELGAARDFIDRCLRIRPFDRRALSYRAAVLQALDTPSDSGVLDFGRLVRVMRPATPEAFATMEDFNRAVAEAVAASPGIANAQPGKTLVGGARLPSIAMLKPALAWALRAMFRAGVDAYAASLPADDPVNAGRPGRFDIAGWASVMEAGAYELPHIHEGGWISGVFYPEMPVALNGPNDAGAIVFGGHDLPEARLPAGPMFPLVPSAGDLVLFPSFLHHRTRAFNGPGRRISVAFDATPS
jgi:tetratricopeptide (TPR) repeat protein